MYKILKTKKLLTENYPFTTTKEAITGGVKIDNKTQLLSDFW